MTNWWENYESPIVTELMTKIERNIERDTEDNLMYMVNQSIGYKIDKEELQKALNYDRDQYNKGYEDAKRQYQRPKSRWLTVSLGRVLCENCTYVNDPWFKYFDYCPNCGADMKEDEEE